MKDVPKIALQRLPRIEAFETHPDADLLTAFAEHLLTEAERGRVLEHVSRCGDCREAVSLALPAGEAVSLPAFVPSRAWLSWPALRWGMVAAGILLITSVGVVRYQRRQPNPELLARNQPTQATLEEDAESKRDGASPGSASSTQYRSSTVAPAREKQLQRQAEDRLLAPRRQQTAASPSASPQPLRHEGSAPGLLKSGQPSRTAGVSSKPPGFAETSPQFAAPASSPLTTAPSERAETQITAQVSANEVSTERRSQAVQVPLRSVDQGAVQGDTRPGANTVGKAKNPVPSAVPSGSASSPRWTISPSGRLQRSFDSGQTWQDVNVFSSSGGQTDSEPNNTYRGQAARRNEESAADKVGNKADNRGDDNSDNKAASKKDGGSNLPASPTAATLIFAVVTAADSEVWAGGSNAALYHSSNSGNNWIRVIPSADGVRLSGDITAIDCFAQHCRISTSGDESWATEDSGQTWHRDH